MCSEENFQELIVANDAWIERDLAHFSMTCSSAAYFFVRWVFDLSAGISAFHFHYAVNLLIYGFYAPKAACAEGGDF